jgi:UDP-N-acetylglucosamine 2-epimerase (non-hydrolysing)
MKIMTILGTRPEIIRLSLIMKMLDIFAEKHILVHTGQNYVRSLSEIFFEELAIRKPDYLLHHQQHSLGRQLSFIFIELEQILLKEKPDKVVILGDTNSALCAVLVERIGIPVVHLEAGNRCFDLSVPEEKNRKIVDAISSVNMPYTEQCRGNLLREGIPSHRIVVTGNPIYEVLQHYSSSIDKSRILEKLKIDSRRYFLFTAHRAENVDHPKHLKEIMNGLNGIAALFQQRIICSIHPKTKKRIDEMSGLIMDPLIEFYEPFGFFDFIKLEKNAVCVLTDSGTVQEECCIFHIPVVTIRSSTERPETVECGSNILSGVNASRILESVKLMVQLPANWICPQSYLDLHVSMKIIKFLLGGKLYV